ncbi:MAG: TonB-dependent receptor, partial [Sphaerochaetaceae bacterium]
MKKRGFFFVLVLALCSITFAETQQYTDLGTAQSLEVTEEKLSDAQANTASTVTVITAEEIKAYNAESTADLVSKAIGTSFNSSGALGAVQTVSIRGMGSGRTLVYLDGAPITSAHDSSFDLSTIPVSVIDHIEIIKSGAGNLGKAVAAGGVINIVTKKAAEDKPTTTIAFENGSFLPKKYTDGSETKQDWRSLVDSQKLDVTYSNKFSDKLALLANIGGIYAANQYTYTSGMNALSLRENAGLGDIHGMVNLNGKLTDEFSYQSNNLVSYQDYRVPGQIKSLSPNDYQKAFTFSTSNSVKFKNVAVNASYFYSPLSYHSESNYGTSDSLHKKHKGDVSVQETWSINETVSVRTGEEVSMDYVDSTDIGEHKRIEPRLYANGSLYFFDGKLQLFPMVSVSYISDFKRISPNASLGLVVPVLKNLDATVNVSYAENAPNFSQLYWPYMSNANLAPEQIANGEMGLSYTNDYFTYQGSVFGKHMTNAIAYDTHWIPQNIASSAYFGTEQAVTVTPVDGLSLTASYLFNQSYDLSNGQKISDGIEVSGIRKHTAKFTATYAYRMFSFSLDGQYLGSTYQKALPSIFLLNANVKARIMDKIEVYAAIDNLLDTDYYFSDGYPMPGMKIR